jgi:hypothetical protein
MFNSMAVEEEDQVEIMVLVGPGMGIMEKVDKMVVTGQTGNR